MSRRFELVLPCYNEAKSLRSITEKAVRAARAAGFGAEDFQLVLVENGSRDDSKDVMCELQADVELSPWLRVVPVPVNEGYGHGVWTGLRSCTAPWVAWSHSDQQCDPADAFRGLAIASGRAGEKVLVKGRRHGRSFPERFVSRTFEFLALLILGRGIHEVNAQPKVFSRDLLSELVSPPKDFAFDLYVLFTALQKGWKIETIDVQFPPRVHGLSNWAHSVSSRRRTIMNMIKYMFRLRREQRTTGTSP